MVELPGGAWPPWPRASVAAARNFVAARALAPCRGHHTRHIQPSCVPPLISFFFRSFALFASMYPSIPFYSIRFRSSMFRPPTCARVQSRAPHPATHP
eukprot:COSAG04_NODE_13669_length_596_cov_1.191147_1_plen_97_part_01